MSSYSPQYRLDLVEEAIRCNNISFVAKKRRICKRTLQRWVKIYNNHGKIMDRPRTGRPKKLTKDNNRYIRDKLKKGNIST